jgi:hypothetical protein
MVTPRDYQPAQLRRWVAALPYGDPLASSRALCEVAFALTPLPMPVDQRLQALGCIAFGERRLVREQTDAAAQGRLQSVHTRRRVHVALRALALELTAGGRQVLNELSGGMQVESTRLAEAMLFVARYLGHAIVLDYQELNPPVRPLWQELHALVLRAEGLGLATVAVRDHDAEAGGLGTVARAYLEVAATALADPYRMPYGMAGWVYAELRQWSDQTSLIRSDNQIEGSGLFQVDLASSDPPAPHMRPQSRKRGQDTLRVIDLRGLAAPLADTLQRLRDTPLPLASIPSRAEAVLLHLERALSLPPRRTLPREARAGSLKLYPGFNAAFGAAGLSRSLWQRPPGLIDDELGAAGESWSFVNEGPAGYAIGSLAHAREPLPIGELVGVMESRAGRDHYAIGVVRWTMVQRGGGQLCGTQIIARRVLPVALACPARGGQPRNALTYERNVSLGLYGLLTDRDCFHQDETYLIAGLPGEPAITVRAVRILETSERFDYFEAVVVATGTTPSPSAG